jgi:hypothetical protein
VLHILSLKIGIRYKNWRKVQEIADTIAANAITIKLFETTCLNLCRCILDNCIVAEGEKSGPI